jgi:hypothetical protein
MATKANIRLALFALRAPALLILLRNVIAKLTGNIFFPATPHTLASMETLADDLESATQNALQGGLAERELRNALVEQTKDVLTQTANYVRATANGDRKMLSTSGFDMARTAEPIGVPGVPHIKGGAATGRTGEVEFRWTGERGAHVYNVLMSATDPSVAANWEPMATTTRTRYHAQDLEPYKAYWFAVSAIGAAGESALSEPFLVRAA